MVRLDENGGCLSGGAAQVALDRSVDTYTSEAGFFFFCEVA